MADFSSLSPRWNIFARELENTLKTHGWELGYLDDRGVVFHREKVRRLRQSLVSPGHLVTLNPEEMERLVKLVPLNALEQKRLNAALLATAVEMTLLDRVGKDVAFRASEDVFEILFEVMRNNPQAMSGVKGGGSIFIDDADAVDNTVSGRALHLLDRAQLIIHIAQGAPTPQTRLIYAQEATMIITHVLTLLQSCREESEEWQSWYADAEAAQRMAEEILRSIQSEGEAQ